jgi:hypothetical protein
MTLKRSSLAARAALLSVFLLFGVALTSPPALALPEGRVYEQVSPVYKGGYGVETLGMESADGERVEFGSLGVFAGAQWDVLTPYYLAQRVAGAGWTSSSLQPPVFGGDLDFSPGLEYGLVGKPAGVSNYYGQATGFEYLVHAVGVPDTPASWAPFGEPLVQADGKPFEGLHFDGSDDLCHLILGATNPLLTVTEHTVGEMYDYSRGCGGSERYVRPLALTNAGLVINPECKVDLGTEYGYEGVDGAGNQNSSFNTVNADGSMIFFTTSVEKKGHCGAHQVFARVGAEHTLELSKPMGEACSDVPCPGAARPSANFTGASEDGSRVFFTSAAQLVAGDKDSAKDLYLVTIGCGEGEADCAAGERRVLSLAQASHDPLPGQAADVQGVLRIAPDGSRVYFVAHGVLSEGPNAENREPVSGADNLYLYDAETGKTTFVADLCSGPELSGAAPDAQCPADLTAGEDSAGNDSGRLWGSNAQEVSSTRDGRVLVFSSFGRLTGDDADSARDVYRFDGATGSLLRVSAGENGYDSNGNDEFDARINFGGIKPEDSVKYKREVSFRSISDDGSRIVFYSSAPLSPRAVKKGVQDIYEWHAGPKGGAGVVSIVSGGASDSSDYAATISPSGRDIFFLTSQGLVPGDQDGLVDVYDARLGGGGFRPAEAERQPCSSDACQGPLTNPAPLLVPGSAVQQAGDNLPGQSAPAPAKTKAGKKRPKCRKAKSRGRKARCIARPRRVRRAR